MIGLKKTCATFSSPLWDTSVENHDSFLHQNRCHVQDDQYNFHDSLLANLIEGIACTHFPTLCDSLLPLFISSNDWFIGLSQCVLCDCLEQLPLALVLTLIENHSSKR